MLKQLLKAVIKNGTDVAPATRVLKTAGANLKKNIPAKQLTLFQSTPKEIFEDAASLAARKRAAGDPAWENYAKHALMVHSKTKLPGVYKSVDDVTYGFNFPYGPQEEITLVPSSKQPYNILIAGAQVPENLRSRVGAAEYRTFLKELGYDLSGVSDEVLGGIMQARHRDLKNMPDVAIARPKEVVLMRNSDTAGILKFGHVRSENGIKAPTVHWYGRTTSFGSPYPYGEVDTWYKGNVTAPLYNAAVLEAQRKGYPGVFSGIALINPEKTSKGLSKFVSIEFPWRGTRSFSGIEDYANAVFNKTLQETGNASAAKREAEAMVDILKNTPEESSTEIWQPGMLRLLIQGKSQVPAKSIFLDPSHAGDILRTGTFVGDEGFYYKHGGKLDKYEDLNTNS